MLGMAWGIATVVLLLAYGNGFERGSLGRLPLLGHEPGLRFSRTHLSASRRHQSRQRSQTHRQRSRLSPGRSAAAQAHFSRSVQAKHRRLRNAQRQLRHQRSLSLLFAHAPHGCAGRHLLHRARRKHAQPRRCPRSRREEETVLRPERAWRKSAARRHFLRGHRRAQARHSERRRQHERQGLHPVQRHERPDEHLLPERGRHGVRRRPRESRRRRAPLDGLPPRIRSQGQARQSLSSTSSPICSTCASSRPASRFFSASSACSRSASAASA